MVGIDLELPINFGHKSFSDFLKGRANVQRTDSFLTTDKLSSKETIRQMRSQIQRQSSDKDLFLFRSIPVYGIRSNNLSSEPPGHRNVSAGNAPKTLPLRHSRQCFQNHSGQSKRESRLENICRLRTGSNKQGANTLRQRRLRHATGPRSLCVGFNHHRFMSVTVSMGKISQTQSSGQGTHTDGLKRLYPYVYPHHRRKSPRCQYPRRLGFRAGGDLCYGSRLPRLRSSFYLYSKPFNLYYESQNQFRLLPAIPTVIPA